MKKAETKDRIKQAMEIRGMKQVELVEKTGIDKGQMSSYLSGKYKPRQKNIDLLAQALSVNEAWLMGFDVPMERHFHDINNLKTEIPQIIQYYEMLNDDGKQEATKRVKELTYIPLYKKDNTLINKHNEIEISEEIHISSHPHFTDVKKAKEYLKHRSYLAAFQFNQKEPTDSDILTMANTLWKASDKE